MNQRQRAKQVGCNPSSTIGVIVVYRSIRLGSLGNKKLLVMLSQAAYPTVYDYLNVIFGTLSWVHCNRMTLDIPIGT